jgi:enediyne biosynthesis protein E4
VNGGNGFASQSSYRAHIGLGSESVIEKLEIRWPTGQKQVFEKIPADKTYRVKEGSAKLNTFTAKATKR